jgi:hypothetical protein
MRSSLMSGLSLRLAKTSVEGGAPSFFADRTGDTVCDDCLFIIVSVLVVLSIVVEVLRKKVLLFFLFAPSKNKKFYLGFRKKTCTSLFCVCFKKSEQQQQREMTSTTNTR